MLIYASPERVDTAGKTGTAKKVAAASANTKFARSRPRQLMESLGELDNAILEHVYDPFKAINNLKKMLKQQTLASHKFSVSSSQSTRDI